MLLNRARLERTILNILLLPFLSGQRWRVSIRWRGRLDRFVCTVAMVSSSCLGRGSVPFTELVF